MERTLLHPRALLLGLLLALLGAPAPAAADEPEETNAFPPGRSRHELEGLRTYVVMPAERPERGLSMVLVLHGAGGSGEDMAAALGGWADDGYVVVAPKASDLTWEPPDVEAARAIALDLRERLDVDPDRVHVVGYSNGGWNLPPLAFDDELKPVSATWIAAGFRGGQVPRWARKRLGAIALAGTEDANVDAARATVDALQDEVRQVEVRTEPGLGHAWPRTLMPYLRWWMGVQEGRFQPGDDMSLDWQDDLDAALASQAGQRRGGVLVWFYAPDDDGEDARELQREVLFDPDVRFLAGQIPAVRLEIGAHAERAEALDVDETPAVVVLDEEGDVVKRYEGSISARRLASALRKVAPERRRPDR